MMKQTIPFFFCILLAGCSDAPETAPLQPNEVIAPSDHTETVVPQDTATNPPSGSTFTVETFETTGIPGFGYRILMNGELYIEQAHIPAIQGTRGFNTPFDAIKTAQFAISKIEKGFMPPTITVEELDSLGVLD